MKPYIEHFPVATGTAPDHRYTVAARFRLEVRRWFEPIDAPTRTANGATPVRRNAKVMS